MKGDVTMDGVTLTLVDTNPKMVEAWRKVFDGECNVEIVRASILDVRADAWVSPTNARAVMNGGVDASIRGRLGAGLQARVRRAMRGRWGDAMPLGTAVCVETGTSTPRAFIATPTMYDSVENVSMTMNVALACAAALQCVRMQNRAQPSSIKHVAMPGLGAGTGSVPHAVCAELMWAAWALHEHHSFDDFGDVHEALAHELGDLDPLPVARRRGPTLPTPYRGRVAVA
jgi:O-acetyl-ADP-ribose deacetylase (regulator of RNase III)